MEGHSAAQPDGLAQVAAAVISGMTRHPLAMFYEAARLAYEARRSAELDSSDLTHDMTPRFALGGVIPTTLQDLDLVCERCGEDVEPDPSGTWPMVCGCGNVIAYGDEVPLVLVQTCKASNDAYLEGEPPSAPQVDTHVNASPDASLAGTYIHVPGMM